jgi:hypothetical protein
VSKNVRIRGYFFKPKGVRQQKSLGKTALTIITDKHAAWHIQCNVFSFLRYKRKRKETSLTRWTRASWPHIENYCDGRSKWKVRRRIKMHTGFWWGSLMLTDHLKDLGVDGQIIWKQIFKKRDGRTCTELTWFRTQISGEIMWKM